AQGELATALDSFRASLTIRERLAAADPGNAGWQRDLSVSHNKIGDVQVTQGDLGAALDSFRASHTIFERLAAVDPGNAGWQRDLAVSNERVGDMEDRNGNTPKAIAAFERALAIYEALLARYPDNTQMRVYSVIPRWRLGRLLGVDGRHHLERALAILKELETTNRLDAERTSWIPKIEAHLNLQ
ncbi:MAG: tetratricopeptide repeat protein, partial [Alphaproteobacteria bacterium]|nr:tetratricopeptide repeat protein [Alphaproteobacteria bacterium]